MMTTLDSPVTLSLCLERSCANAFPELSTDRLRFVLGIHSDDVDKASAFFVTLSSLLDAMKSFLVRGEEEEEEDVRVIKVEDFNDQEKLKEEALAFYRDDNFDCWANLRVRVKG